MMLQQLAFFNNKIFVPFFDGLNAYLLAYEYTIIGENKGFEERHRHNIPIRLNLKIRNILLEIANNHLTGFRILIIVVIYDHQKIAIYFYEENAKNILYESDFICSFPKNLVPNINVAFTHGPMCLMVTKGELCAYSLLHLSKKSYNFYVKDIISYDEVKILQLLTIEAIYSTFNVILVALSIKTNEDQVILFGALLLNNNGGIFSNEFIILPETSFLPKNYHNEVNAIRICGLNFSEFLESVNLNILELPWTNNISIVTFPEKCIIFKGGKINYCIEVPLLNINSILVNSNALFSFCGNVNIILQSASKGVCFINKKANFDKFEVIQTWNNAMCALIGDFFKNSSLQLLLLLNISFEKWQDGFILSEFSSLPTAPLEQHKIPDEYLKNTVIGLSNKIHAGKLSIAKKENEIFQKTSATLDALYRLDECSSKVDDCDLNYISSFQESLVDIILHADENLKNDQELENIPLTIKIENHWSTLLLNHWILCWTLKNESNNFICYPMVFILFENIEVQCIQKLFVHNSSTYVETMAENEIEPGKTFMLVTSFEIPPLFENEIEVNAIITWQKGKVSDNNSEYLNLKEKNLNLQFVTISKLNMADIFLQQTNKDIFKEEEFISLKALQQRNIFFLTAYKSDLSDLKNSLLKNDSINKLSPLDDSHFMFREEKSPLFGICLNFSYIHEKNIEIEAFTRNQKETLLLVQWLYHSLPDDIIIMAKENSTEKINAMKKKILISMKEELDLITSSLNIFNIIPKLFEENDPANLNLPDMNGVIIPKESYARIRKVLAKKEIFTDIIMKNLI